MDETETATGAASPEAAPRELTANVSLEVSLEVPLEVPPDLQLKGAGKVSALLTRPAAARWLLVLAHGAGAGMEHPFLEALTGRLAQRGVATLRYQFPYMDSGKGWPPDRPPLLVATVRAAVARGREVADGLPLFAGGKSLGGRMTSTAAAEEDLDGVRGLVFVGFPLHTAKNPGTKRADHLPSVAPPMLFLQGTRDKLADLDLLRPVVEDLGDRATLHVVEGADHGFSILKRSGRSDAEVLDELAAATAGWMERICPDSGG